MFCMTNHKRGNNISAAVFFKCTRESCFYGNVMFCMKNHKRGNSSIPPHFFKCTRESSFYERIMFCILKIIKEASTSPPHEIFCFQMNMKIMIFVNNQETGDNISAAGVFCSPQMQKTIIFLMNKFCFL